MLYEITESGIARPTTPVLTSNEADELQLLLARNLHLLPGEQIDPESPRRWMLIRREMPVPDPGGGGSRWSVDLLLTDQDGVPTFVECKRYADTRARREVVGQMLEYAANGHHYWDRAELRSYLEESAAASGANVESLFEDLGSEEFDSTEELLERFVENLREGQVRLVFFMEEAPQELKSIVDFLNRQTERTEVVIVEAKQYQTHAGRFVAPALFGYTEEARRAKRSVTVTSSGSRRKWDEPSFFIEAESQLQTEQVSYLRGALDLARDLSYEISWGSGKKRGSFSVIKSEICPRSFFSFLTDGTLWVNLGYVSGSEEADALRSRVIEEVHDRVGLPPKGDPGDEFRFEVYALDEWYSYREGLLDVLRRVRGLSTSDTGEAEGTRGADPTHG